MRKWIFLTALAAVLALGAFAVANLDAYLTRNRQWFAARVEEALGRPVVFDEIGVSFAGGFGVRVGGVRIPDDPAFSSGDVLRAKSALVRVRLVPALFGRYEVTRVALERPVLTVLRTAAGLNVARPAGSAGSQDPRAANRTGAAAALAVALVDIDRGELRYTDSTTDPPTELVLADLHLEASDVRSDRPLSFELEATALGAAERNVHARGNLGPLEGDLADTPLALELRTQALSIADLARLPEVAAAIPDGLEIAGPLAVSLDANGTWAHVRYQAVVDASAAVVTYGGLFAKPASLPLIADVNGTRSADTLGFERARLHTDHASLDLAATSTTGAEAVSELTLDADDVAIADLAPLVPALAGFDVVGTLDLALRIRRPAGKAPGGYEGSLAIDGLQVRDARGPLVGGFTAKAELAAGSGTAAPVTFELMGAPAVLSARLDTSAKPTLTFSLASQAVPLGERVAPAPAGAAPDVLRGVQVDGALRWGASALKLRANAVSDAGTVAGVPYENFTADVRLDDGRAVFAPIAADAFGGTLRGEGVYDVRAAAEPSFNFEMTLAGVRLAQLAAAFGARDADRLDATTNAKLTIAGSGASRDAVLKSLIGGGDIALRGGMLRRLNFVNGMLASLAGLPGLSEVFAPGLLARYPRLFASDDTSFDSLEARIAIADGRMTSDKMTLRASDFTAAGGGFVAFNGDVNLRMSVELSEALSADLVGFAGDLKGIENEAARVTLPVLIDGSAPNLRARPELDRIAHTLQKTAVQQYVDGILDRERLRIQHGAPPTLPPTSPPAPDSATTKGARDSDSGVSLGAFGPPVLQPHAPDAPGDADSGPAPSPPAQNGNGGALLGR